MVSTSCAAQHPDVIRIGVAAAGLGGRPFAANGYFAVLHVKHFLEQEFSADKIGIEWHFFTGAGPAVNEALAGGQLDFAWQGDLPAIIGRAGGIKTRLLLVAGRGNNLYLAVPAASKLQTLADLKGSTLAEYQGTAPQLSIARILDSVGLSRSDLKVVNLDQANTLSALVANQIDAAFTVSNAFSLRDRGLIRFIYSTKGQSPTFKRHEEILVTDAFATAYADVVDRVVKVAVSAAHWASDEANREALYEIWANSGYPVTAFSEEFDGEELRVNSDPVFDDFMTAQYHRSAADALRFELIRAPVSVDDWIDRAPLTAALASLELTDYWPH
jgi:sulfonate transport system substrate-binding protein